MRMLTEARLSRVPRKQETLCQEDHIKDGSKDADTAGAGVSSEPHKWEHVFPVSGAEPPEPPKPASPTGSVSGGDGGAGASHKA